MKIIFRIIVGIVLILWIVFGLILHGLVYSFFNDKEIALETVKNTLKEHGGDGTTYSPEQKRLMVWYTYFFLNRGKPSTHFSVLSSIEPITLKERMPEVFDRLIIQAEQKIKDGFGEDNNA